MKDRQKRAHKKAEGIDYELFADIRGCKSGFYYVIMAVYTDGWKDDRARSTEYFDTLPEAVEDVEDLFSIYGRD